MCLYLSGASPEAPDLPPLRGWHAFCISKIEGNSFSYIFLSDYLWINESGEQLFYSVMSVVEIGYSIELIELKVL